MEILNDNRVCLENQTQAVITCIRANDLTTPINGSPDQVVSKPQRSKSPLPYIMGVVGAVLILVVVLFIVR